MNKAFAIAWKDTLLRFSGWAEWIFFLVLPIVFTVILAGGTGGSSDGRVRLAVVDQSGAPLGGQMVAALEKSAAVRPDVMTLEQADSQFNQRQVAAVLIIPAGFDQESMAQGAGSLQIELRQQPNNIDATVAQRAVQAVIGRVSSAADVARQSVSAAEDIRPFASAQERQAYFDAALKQAQTLMDEAPTRLAVSSGATKDEVEYDPRANSSAGQLITWVFVPLLSISSMFAYERQKGTLRRLLVTPTRKATYLLGTIAGQVATAIVQMLLLVGFGILVMKLN